MPKLVCVSCQTELKPETIGTLTIETASFGPYKVWYSDVYKCPGCGIEIITGFPEYPLRQDHYKPDFTAWLKREKELAPRVEYDHECPRKAGQ